MLAAPVAPNAQRTKNTRRLGILHIISERSYLSWAFINELRDQGWVEGQNLIIEERFLRSDTGGVPDPALLARELLERRVEALATFSPAAVEILKQVRVRGSDHLSDERRSCRLKPKALAPRTQGLRGPGDGDPEDRAVRRGLSAD